MKTNLSNQSPGHESGLEAVLGYRDLVLFYVCAIFGIRLIPLAASIGPSVFVIWLVTMLTFYVPQALAVVDLSTRFPGEGGIYLWSREAFGEFHGFLTAWAYWTSALVFFPSVLLFLATQTAFLIPGSAHLADRSSYLTCVSLAVVAGVFVVNLVGLRTSTLLHNISAAARFAAVAFIVVLGVGSWLKHGPATDLSLGHWIPSLDTIKNLVFLSTFAYMFAGVESASILGDEVREPKRNIPKAIITSGGLIMLLYVVASLALLLALSPGELTGLQGFSSAITASATALGGDVFAVWATSIGALLLILVMVGMMSVWFAASARLPFVVGLDRYLPLVFGRVHPRFGTPWVSLATLALATAFFVVLSGLGGAAEQVYNILVSLEIVIFFIPYLYMFSALIRLAGRRGEPGAVRVPGGVVGGVLVGSVGLLVTAGTLIMALIPGGEVLDHRFFYLSVFGSLAGNLLAGIALYAMALWRRPKVMAGQSQY